MESIQKMPTNNKEAYDLYLQAEFQRFKSSERAFANAIPLYEQAIALLKTTDPLYNENLFYLRETTKLYYYLGEFEKSKDHLKKIMDNFTDLPPILLWLNAVYHHMDGNKEGVALYLAELNEKYEASSSGNPAWFIALYHCVLEDYENAFTWLQKPFDHHEVEMTWFQEEPLLIPLRNDPRYKDLYRKIGFPKINIQ